MQAKILSLNCGTPTPLEWNGKSVSSSMLHHPVPGPLLVHKDHIEGNSFGSPHVHGLEHSVLYAYGMKSALEFVKLLGLSRYEPGAVGENVTLDELDETQISVGDIFQFGEVQAEATHPRVPCGKVSLRMQRPDGQKAMQRCGRSGVYFRVLKPGKIFAADEVKRVSLAKHRFPISEVYAKIVAGVDLGFDERKLALANGAFPKKVTEKWTALPQGTA
jgi:MOSC domain-containing protein YiiM